MKKNYIFAIITVFIWSTMAAVSKLVMLGIPNLQTLGISGFFAFLFLLLLNIKKGKIKELKKYSPKDFLAMSGLGFLGLFLYTALYYYGLTQLSAQVACILNYLWPMMIVLFSCLILKEKMTWLKAVAMVCSFLGIVLLSFGDGGFSSEGGALGAVCCVLAAAFYGLFSVLNKKADYDQGIAMMIFWLVTAVFSTIFGVLTEDWVQIQGSSWLGLLWLGIIVNAVAYLLWALALKGAENTATVANFAYLTPFLSLVVSNFVLEESISISAFSALVLIVGGILLQSIFEHRKK